MITGSEFYKVMCAMAPLYFAMFVAYGSVKWWKIFTAEQCSGINRFVSVFAVPILSFHFISQNNPYKMDMMFIIADTLSKVMVLVLLSLWAILFKSGGLDWLITLFSVATLPNTLVMGIPLLQAMYGDYTQNLMVQLVVLQCIIWYTLLLFLFELRGARLLIRTEFPGQAAGSITRIQVDDDVISLDGMDPLRTETETDINGRVMLRIRRSISSVPDSVVSSSLCLTPRASNLSNAEIFSVNTPNRFFNGGGGSGALQFYNGNNEIMFCNGDLGGFGFTRPGCGVSPRRLSGYASSDAYSLQPTPRASNFNELDVNGAGTPVWMKSPVAGRIYRHAASPKMTWESGQRHVGKDSINAVPEKEISFRDALRAAPPPTAAGVACSMEEGAAGKDTAPVAAIGKQEMPSAALMVRLILTVVGRKLSRNPNTYSSIIGLVWSLISFRWNIAVPDIVAFSIKIISDAGLGMAMFSLGLFMALQPKMINCGAKKATIGMLIRFITGPAFMAAASVIVGLKGSRLHAAIVQAALPQGIVPFVFAREYGLHPDLLSTLVIFGMIVSLPVTILYYVLLGL
ncbi:putative auxin efflux carrier component 6 [Raphanus sativus]|uniref:Auxin efflux carrier component n=1 Tax=Raphanus sativus TaxID=3726 RepID=A0A6J0K615_RAPSA|nr:auxin efflux carrier component 6 isoform X1 [Raphanus sativus]KAJ4883975.1 putative auxin efflux carrier component 6 [Raphanus sativus]